MAVHNDDNEAKIVQKCKTATSFQDLYLTNSQIQISLIYLNVFLNSNNIDIPYSRNIFFNFRVKSTTPDKHATYRCGSGKKGKSN
jgi:hypothetical protein